MSERKKLVDEVALDLFRRQHPTPGPEREKAWLMYGADYVSDVTETIAAIEAAGVRLVPSEATHKMADVGEKARWQSAVRDADNVREIWRAMLAASPYNTKETK